MSASRQDQLDSGKTVYEPASSDATQFADEGTVKGGLRPAAEFADSPFPRFGRFEIVRPIGGGGMGRVFEVIDPETQQKLALKTWRSEDPILRAGLAQEFLSLSRLRHPNLVRLYECSLSDPFPFFTMELLSGQELLSYVRPKVGSGPGGFHEGRLREAFRQLVEGLSFLHSRGVLHRDIKPSNVLVNSSGTVKLLDFGVAVTLNNAGTYEPTVFGTTAGTDKYMSPAQAAGGSLTPADDWYSVGLVLFECLTGEFPFAATNSVGLFEAKRNNPQGLSPKTRNPAVPSDLDAICAELLQNEASHRPDGGAILRRLGVENAVAALPVHRSELLGRQRELEALNKALTSVQRTGKPRMIFVHGNSGVGKSELVTRFLDDVTQRGDVRVFRGRCYENVFAPYQAFQELLTDVCRHLRKLPALERQAVLPSDVHSLREVFPVFSDHGVVPPVQRSEVHSSAQERRQHGFLALRELLLRMGPASALEGALPLLFVDDLQWGDLDSLALLVELMRSPSPPPFLFVGSFRDEDAATSPFLQALRDTSAGHWSTPPEFVNVKPLTMEDAERLAAELLAGDDGAAAEVRQAIARQSRGNPLFVAELVQYWRISRGRALSEKLSLDGLLQQRVGALAGELRRLVQLVAIAGRPVPARELFQAAGLVSVNIDWVQDLKDGHFLRTVGTAERSRLDTFHDRVRESVLSALAPEQRREMHERWLTALLPDASGKLGEPSVGGGSIGPGSSLNLNTGYEFIAQQLLGAGRRAEAASYLRLEADEAAASFAFDRAAALYRLALANHGAEDDTARTMRIALAESLANTGQSANAAVEFLAAAKDASEELSLDLRRRAAQRYLTSGHAPEGLAVLREVFAKVGLYMPSTRVGTLASLIYWRTRLWWRGLDYKPRDAATVTRLQQRLDASWAAVIGLSLLDPIRAADFVARNVWLALEMGNPAYIVRALALYSSHFSVEGPAHARSAEQILDAARRASKYAPGEYAKGMVALSEGITAHLQCRWSKAITSCDRAEGLFRRCEIHDVTWELDMAQTFAMWALMFRGDMAEMTRRQPKLADEAIERNDRFARLNFGTVVMTHVNLAADRAATAREMLADDEKLLMKGVYHVQHHNAALARVFLELYDEQPLAAWQSIKDGWRPHVLSLLGRVQKVRIDFFQVYGRSAVGALAVDRQSPVLRKAAQKAIRQLRGEQIPWASGMADAIEAGKLACEGQHERAAAALQSAVARFEAAEMPLLVAAAERQLARLQSATEEVERIDSTFQRMGVVHPARMTAALIPGFER